MIDDVDAFVKVAEVLKERGAYKVYVMATHGLLSSEAPRLLEESSIDEVNKIFLYCHLCGYAPLSKHMTTNVFISLQIVVTNTVPHEIQKMQCHKIKTVDISIMLTEAIRRIQNNESMSYLFRNIGLDD